jgi:hypothetical protein
MSYEESDISRFADITAASNEYAALKAHITVHTLTLPWLFVLLLVATGFQGMSVFGGDLWRLEHHYDFFSSEFHHFALNVTDVFGIEHPFSEYRKQHPEVHVDHPHHHSNLEKVISSHSQLNFLFVAFHAYLLIPITTLLRYYFFLKKQSYLTTLIIMIVISISAIAEIIALIGNIMVLVTVPSLWIYIKIFITLLVFAIEAVTVWDLYRIRKYVMYFSMQYFNLKVDESQESQEEIVQEAVENPYTIPDMIQTGIANLYETIDKKKKKSQ